MSYKPDDSRSLSHRNLRWTLRRESGQRTRFDLAEDRIKVKREAKGRSVPRSFAVELVRDVNVMGVARCELV
jgi:hypothetical protein